jgi:NMD protein affecting ribosome stability and mRNA decay
MTPAEINKTIAEFCGICLHARTEHYEIEDGNSIDSGFTCLDCGKDTYGAKRHDWTSSFDALREAEGRLSERQRQIYSDILREVAAPSRHVGAFWFADWLLFTCTPLQRATALAETVQQSKGN